MNEDEAATCKEERVSTRRVFEGRVLRLRVDEIKLPNGAIHNREVVEHAPAVVIAAENDAGQLLLIEQFRYPTGRVITELPAGVIEDGEEPLTAASRELQEETGWKSGDIRQVHSFYASPGYCDEVLHLFHARSLKPEKLPHDEDEFIVARFFNRDEVLEMVRSGETLDGKTLIGAYWWLYERTDRT